jgi:hypothetical protein
MDVRIEGHVMVHRTDIAGSCRGQASLRRDGRCRLVFNATLLENSSSIKRGDTLPSFHGGASRFLSRTPDAVRL